MVMMEADRSIDESRDLERSARREIEREKKARQEVADRQAAQKAKEPETRVSAPSPAAAAAPAAPPPDPYAGLNAAADTLKGRTNMLMDMYTKAGERTAPQLAGMTPISTTPGMYVSPTSVQAYTAEGATIDPRATEMTYAAAQGLAPSVAQNLLTQGVSQAGQLGMALAGARGGYSPAAVRGAQRQAAEAVQSSAAQAAALRAQEMATARQEFSNLQVQQANLTQQARQFNATQEGQAALANAENDLRAKLANQGMDLDILKTNAARGDAFAMANLQAELDTMQLNQAAQIAYISQVLGIDEQMLTNEMFKLEYQQRPELARMGYQAQKDIALQERQARTTGTLIDAFGKVISAGVA